MILTPAPIAVNVDLLQPRNRIVPLRAIGAALDAEPDQYLPAFYAKPDVDAMLSAGLGPVTYRLYTELAVQAWHWNPNGSFSAAGGGYWTGDAAPGSPIERSFGYRLPHRGFTLDPAGTSGYSRLDDGDPSTYWKSDPYLSQRYTGDPDTAHPQWALVDIGTVVPVEAIRIAWRNPYATAYTVQYWTGSDAIYDPARGRWAAFARGAVTGASGGTVTLRLDAAPVRARFVRVLMSASSGTCDTHGSADPRDCLGYAIGELGVGTLDRGAFHDWVRHQPNRHQTATYVSSEDSWHARSDVDVYDEVQPGLDAVFESGLTRGMPAFVPVSLLYGTPDDAAAELRYLRARGDAVYGVELGEEPDGQFVVPEDDAALYLQWARRLHTVDPSISLGGPVFQGVNSDVQTWPDSSGNVSWLNRFLGYLRAHGALNQLQFMSFEHYPFGPCGDAYAHLLAEPQLAANILDVWRSDGVPPSVPFFVTEMNYSGADTDVFQSIPGALWFADAAGSFLSSGAGGVFLYQYAPEPLQRSAACAGYGSYGMFSGTLDARVRQRTAEYFAAQLLMQQWAQPVDAAHEIYATASTQPAVSAYGIKRPDGEYAVLLINKDSSKARTVSVRFDSEVAALPFSGTVTRAEFGEAQYVWHGASRDAYASPDGPAAVTQIPAAASYLLEPGSVTVLRGRVKI